MIDAVLPDFDARSTHDRWVDAAAGPVWDALAGLRFDELPLTRLLLGLRAFGLRAPTGEVLRTGPVRLLRAEPGREAVAGAVLRSWTLRPTLRHPADVEQFTAFDEPGWVKVATDFRLVPDGSGTRLSTETRIRATDPGARRRFALYWAAIRPWSGLVRRDLLTAVARKATAA